MIVAYNIFAFCFCLSLALSPCWFSRVKKSQGRFSEVYFIRNEFSDVNSDGDKN